MPRSSSPPTTVVTLHHVLAQMRVDFVILVLLMFMFWAMLWIALGVIGWKVETLRQGADSRKQAR